MMQSEQHAASFDGYNFRHQKSIKTLEGLKPEGVAKGQVQSLRVVD